MVKNVSRRDFLKLASAFPLSYTAPRFLDRLNADDTPENIIVVVFDAFSAHNIPFHGYQRNTTPQLARLADRAVVYHNHYAGGNFTAPGTASLLTGTLPWKHRAFHHGGKIDKKFVTKSIFSAFETFHRLAYSHNPMANGVLGQFNETINDFVPRSRLFLKDDSIIPTTLFEDDDDIATVSWLRALKGREEGFSYSLFLSHMLYALETFQDRKIANLQEQFPTGLPRVFTDSYYMLEDAVDWFGNTIGDLPHPFISYLHFMPPHAPYKTHREFFGRFENDRWFPESKPLDLFYQTDDEERMRDRRAAYDEFVLYADREFGRFFDHLEDAGILENTWVILTSDHGEMFERGIIGHKTPVLYEPVVRIPLLIFEPGRKSRMDIHTPTSAVDILPTLLHVTGQPPIDWTEGVVLPPYSDTYPSNERSVYVVEARQNRKYEPLSVAVTALIKGQYKLMRFFGYNELNGVERLELYDVENDPEETRNIFDMEKLVARDLLDEMKVKLVEVNEPYL
jgi:choline-sulfatase